MRKKIYDYFHGNLSAKQEEDVQKELCGNAGNHDADIAMREMFEECCRKASARRSPAVKAIPYIVSAAAAIAALICLPKAYDMGRKNGEDRIAAIEWVEESVPLGEERTVTLADGTVIHLNSGSRLTYPREFSGAKRGVFVSGEAFVQVAKDAAHPFVINSADVKVTVLGTTFNFKNYSDCRNVELLLMEGSVKASVSTSSGEKEVRLSPGDKMRFDRIGEKIDLERFSPNKYKAFYENHSLHFFDVEMTDIAKELSRRFNQPVVVQDAALASRRYFAIFTNNETLDEVLEAMNADKKMKITKTGGIVYLHSK